MFEKGEGEESKSVVSQNPNRNFLPSTSVKSSEEQGDGRGSEDGGY
jgi:hypothetical protein